jgi:hypothetical protein
LSLGDGVPLIAIQLMNRHELLGMFLPSSPDS